MARVLIVDADARVRSSLRGILERRRHEVHEAARGQDGMTAVMRLGIQLVFTDVSAPEVQGLDFIEEMCVRAPNVPIVAMSGGQSAQAMAPLAGAVNLGATAFLVKPFTVEGVVTVLGEVLPPA